MKRKLIGIGTICIIIAIGILTLISKQEKVKEQQLRETVKKENMSLQEVRDSVEAFMEKGKAGEYRNLTFDTFTPAITEKDCIYKLSINYPDRYKNYDDEKLLETQMNVLKSFYGEDIDLSYVSNYMENISYEKMKKQMKEGNYESKSVPFLVYHKDEIHAQVDGGISSLWVDMGELKGNIPRENYKIEDKLYYRYAADASLKDSYQTKSGKMTVEQAITELETYFNDNFPIEKNSEERYKADRIRILKIKDNQYAFDIGYRREYDGVLFEYEDSGTMGIAVQDQMDMSEAVVAEEGKVTFFNGFNMNSEIVRGGEEIKTVISLDRALGYIAEKLGNETEYHVTGIELAYKETLKKEGSEAVPVWKFCLRNQTDNKVTFFYVDVVTGELSSRTREGI